MRCDGITGGRDGAVNEKSLANLKPFQPGQSGNPSGGSKRRLLTDALNAELQRVARKGDDKTQAHAIIRRLVNIVLTGDRSESVAAAKLLWSYHEGQPVQTIDLEVRRAADRLAAATGADAEFLIRRAQQLAADNGEAVVS